MLLLAALALALIWPAMVNRAPFYTPDTRSYMRGADAIVNKLTHRTTVWTASEDRPALAAGSASPKDQEQALHNIGEARTRSLTEISRKGIVAGRSPFYGMLLYAGHAGGGFWLTTLLQSGALLVALWLTLRALGQPAWPQLAWLGLGLCFLSDAPFFVSYLLPDLFAGIAILACGLLIGTKQRFAWPDGVLWYPLLSAAMLFHDSCTLICAALLGLAVVVNLLRRSWANGRGLCVILLAIVTAFAGQSLLGYGVQRATGTAMQRLPFLSARLVADGPGTRYLRANCPQSHFALCAYADEFPISDAAFLFGNQPGQQVFETASYEQRRALSQEQVRFFLAVLQYDPVGVLKDGVRNAFMQLIDFRLLELRYDEGMKDVMDRTFPLPVLAQVKASGAYRGTLPVTFLTVALYVTVLFSLAWLIFNFYGTRRARAMSRDLKRVFLWIAAGLIINAAACGALSAVDARYQARVVWLLPLLALLVWFDARKGGKEPSINSKVR